MKSKDLFGNEIDDESVGKKFDTDKLKYDLIYPQFEQEIAAVLTHGAKKYKPNNWKLVPDAKNRYYAAMRRHIASWRMGEKYDSESNLHHLAHAAVNAMFLMWFDADGGDTEFDALSDD
mgnify:CR=1 FL=1